MASSLLQHPSPLTSPFGTTTTVVVSSTMEQELVSPPRMPPQGTSRLAQMQARFQQRQLQEKEAKLLQMLENQQQRALQRVSGRGSAGSTTSSNSSNASNGTAGKVRQMFEEQRRSSGAAGSGAGARRTGGARSGPAATTGWDRSYPLDPLSSNKRGPQSISANRPAAGTRGVPPAGQSKLAAPTRTTRDVDVSVRGYRGRDGNANQVLSPNDDLPSMFGKLANVGARNGASNNNVEHEDTHDAPPAMPRKPMIKSLQEPKFRPGPAKKAEAPRAPVSTPPAPSSPAVAAPMSPSRPSPMGRRITPSSPARSGSASSSATGSLAASPEPHVQKNSSGSSLSRAGSATPSPAPPAANQGPIPAGMAECTLCSRRFAEDRIAKHEEICRKTKSKKRKVFDPVKMRTQGTEVESFVKKSGKKMGGGGSVAAKKAEQAAALKKSNWRKKHEEFIESIRAAKQVQAHIAAGGKASDLPPPKPLDTSDYVQCPHCGRKFSEGAAERHVPRCANIKSNKPAANKAPTRRR